MEVVQVGYLGGKHVCTLCRCVYVCVERVCNNNNNNFFIPFLEGHLVFIRTGCIRVYILIKQDFGIQFRVTLCVVLNHGDRILLHSVCVCVFLYVCECVAGVINFVRFNTQGRSSFIACLE